MIDKIPHTHLHHQSLHGAESGTAHDGHHRGSEQASEKHGDSKGESEPLVHHPSTSDWHEHAAKTKNAKNTDLKNNGSKNRERAGNRHDQLPSLEIGGHDQDRQSLTNSKLAPAQRLEAARHLVRDGVHSMHFKDEQGKDHDYRIQLFNSGHVRVSEGSQTVLQDNGERAGQPAVSEAAAAHERVHNESLADGQAGKQMHSRSHSYRQSQRPAGLSETSGGQYRYDAPAGGRSIEAPQVDAPQQKWSGVKNVDGSVTIGFTGCEVDTDGHGASRHGEDPHRRAVTSLTRSDGRYLDTDKDNFVVLSPKVAAAYGIQIGDLGWLVRKDTGAAVPVVFGDTGHEGRRTAEASVAALTALGYGKIDGNNGVTGGRFEIVLAPGSGNGRGDIARNPTAIAAKLQPRAVASAAPLQ